MMTNHYNPSGGTSERLDDPYSWLLSGKLFETREQEYYGVRETSYNLAETNVSSAPVGMELETKTKVPPDTVDSNDVLVPVLASPKTEPLTEDESSSSSDSETGSSSDSSQSSTDSDSSSSSSGSSSETNGSIEIKWNSGDEDRDRCSNDGSSPSIRSDKDLGLQKIIPIKVETVTTTAGAANLDLDHSHENSFSIAPLSPHKQLKNDPRLAIESTNYTYSMGIPTVLTNSDTSYDIVSDAMAMSIGYQLQIPENGQRLNLLGSIEVEGVVPNDREIPTDSWDSLYSKAEGKSTNTSSVVAVEQESRGNISTYNETSGAGCGGNDSSHQGTNDNLPSRMQFQFPNLQQYQHHQGFKWHAKCSFINDLGKEIWCNYGEDFTPSPSHTRIDIPQILITPGMSSSSPCNMNPVQLTVPHSPLLIPVPPKIIGAETEIKTYALAKPGGLLPVGILPLTVATLESDVYGGEGQNQIHGQHTVQKPEFTLPLPLDSEDDVEKLDDFLGRTSANRVHFVEKLAKTGGSNTASATRRVMAKLLTNSLAVKYNWAGRNKKFGFAKHKNIFNSVFGSVEKKYPHTTELEVENKIKEWLKTAKARLKLKMDVNVKT